MELVRGRADGEDIRTIRRQREKNKMRKNRQREDRERESVKKEGWLVYGLLSRADFI